MKRIIGMLSVIMAAVIISFSIIRVQGAEQGRNKRDADRYYEQLENEYMDILRGYLEERGFSNAGITVTHLTDINGHRSYTVKIHHRRFEMLEEDEKAFILKEASDLGFEDEICEFRAVLF